MSSNFQVLWWEFAKFLMLFSKQQLSFLKILHHSLVSWKITPLYFFRWIITYFSRKGPMKVHIFETWIPGTKFTKFLSLLKQQIAFSSNFALSLNIMRHNSFVLFKLKFYKLATKGVYQGANLVKSNIKNLALSWVSLVIII